MSKLATFAKSTAAPKDTRESDLIKQFAASRARIQGQRSETERQAGQSLNRLQAVAGNTGGAIEEARQRSIKDIGTAFGDVESGLGAQEAAAKQQLATTQRGEALQREALEFQKSSFQQELEENKKTNLINAAVALNEAGLDNDKRWHALMQQYFGKNFNNPKFEKSARPTFQTPLTPLPQIVQGGNVGSNPLFGTTNAN